MPMNSRERVETALSHREPDRTPIFEYILLSPIADKVLNRPYAGDSINWQVIVNEKGWGEAVHQNAIDRVELASRLGHDMMYVSPNPLPENKDVSSKKSVENLPNNPVERVRYRNKKTAQSFQSLPDESFLIYVYLKKEMEYRGLDFPILAPAYGHGIWTDVDLMETIMLEPDVAHEHFSLSTQQALKFIERYVPLGVSQIAIGGDFAGNTLIISPETYRHFIMPEVRVLSKRIHKAGCFAINASDGNLWPVIEDFLLGCEADGYIEIDLHAGMDIERLKSMYGEQITFYGNLDCGNILSFASPEEVKQHTIACLEAGMGNGGHILCASNAITSSISLQNYLAVQNAYRDMFKLPEINF